MWGIRSSAKVGLIGSAALLMLGVSSAAADVSVTRGGDTILISDNAPEDNAITLSSDGTTITVTDTAAGAVDADMENDCDQVDPNTVTCPIAPNAENSFPVTRYDVNLAEGVDSFTNLNFVANGSSVGGFGEGSKTINAGPGNQSVSGGEGNDTLRGQDGDDFLDDGSGCCIFLARGGGGGSTGPSGNDVLDGGPGEDTAEYDRRGAAVTITLDGLANDGEAGEADNVQTEDVATGDGDDVVIGDAAPNSLSGGSGSDRLVGAGGNDELAGDFTNFGPSRLSPAMTRAKRGGGPFVISGNDTLDGGPGRDGLNCGRGIDLALREPIDEVHVNCERIGAEIVDDNSPVKTKRGKKQGKLKVRLQCAPEEGAACVGKLKIKSDGKGIGKGRFNVAAGKTKNGKAKLNKRGLRKLRAAGGSLVVTVTAKTSEPGGVAIDRDQVQIHR